jgi:signal transduction histidine kinase
MPNRSFVRASIIFFVVFGLFLGIAPIVSVYAQDDAAREALAKESEDYCASTESTKPTPELVIQKVNEGAELVAKEGEAAFPKFQGKGSPFLFAGTYIWIHDGAGVMRMHPIKWKMNGKDYIGLKDTTGKRFFAEMNDCVRSKGACWIDYMWPKPGEKDPSRKISYVKLVKTPNGQEFILGCGIYDVPEAEMNKLLVGK